MNIGFPTLVESQELGSCPKKLEMAQNYRLSFPQNVELMETNKVSREKNRFRRSADFGKSTFIPL